MTSRTGFATARAPRTRMRVLAADAATSVLHRTAETLEQFEGMSVHSVSDIEPYVRMRSMMLVPDDWHPDVLRVGSIVVLTGRTLAVAAIEAGGREARRTGATLVVLQPLTVARAVRWDSRALRSATSEQQERLDMQLAGLDVLRSLPAVPVVGEVVLDDVSAIVRGRGRTTALLVAEPSALDSPALRAGLDAALDETGVPVLIVVVPPGRPPCGESAPQDHPGHPEPEDHG